MCCKPAVACKAAEGFRPWSVYVCSLLATDKATTLVGWAPPSRFPHKHEICEGSSVHLPSAKLTVDGVAVFVSSLWTLPLGLPTEITTWAGVRLS